jgi:NAD(P)H-hydrate repair Nnr-like enzyme with NAD(P)H-hydrate epimerase domain
MPAKEVTLATGTAKFAVDGTRTLCAIKHYARGLKSDAPQKIRMKDIETDGQKFHVIIDCETGATLRRNVKNEVMEFLPVVAPTTRETIATLLTFVKVGVDTYPKHETED